MTPVSGYIRKMQSQLDKQGNVQYHLPIGDDLVDINALIGQQITLNYDGKIACCNCGKQTKKSYSQGFCYVCMQKLAQCDMCIMKPETCHYEQGTCREPEWGESHCMIPHYVYLANTSAVKVGITRHTQIPTRWIDQGATQALPIFKVNTRLQSGLVEIALAKFISDKTNWRNMLKAHPDSIDLKAKADELKPQIMAALAELRLKFGDDAVTELDEDVVDLNFPVIEYLSKISSFNFDKTPEVTGTLLGVKGQYLIFDNGVLNIRKFGSYHLILS